MTDVKRKEKILKLYNELLKIDNELKHKKINKKELTNKRDYLISVNKELIDIKTNINKDSIKKTENNNNDNDNNKSTIKSKEEQVKNEKNNKDNNTNFLIEGLATFLGGIIIIGISFVSYKLTGTVPKLGK